MQDLINKLNNSNLLVLLAIIFAVILALIIIIVIEKIDKRRKDVDLEYYQEDFDDDNDLDDEIEDEIVYVDDEPSVEEAKQTLIEVQKKLVEEDDGLIGPTHFEMEQEEKSIISYEELKKASFDVDERNDKLLEDDGHEPITIEELYKIHVEENDKEELDNPIYEEEVVYEKPVEKVEVKKETNSDKKFKNSEVISPVFGIYKQEEAAYRKVAPIKREEKRIDVTDVELEIEKTQAFLEELKILKSKLK